MKNVYSIRDLTKMFPGAAQSANEGITFDVPAGEVVALIGPNGAGKTTLARMLLGLLKPTRGAIELFGRDVINSPEIVSSHAAYLPQQGFGRALGCVTAQEAITSMGRLRGQTRQAAKAEADTLMERLGLSSEDRTPLQRLSGGKRRLAALAAVLCASRPLLVLDEPTNDLDAEARRAVWDLLAELRARRKITVILITHNILEADRVVDRVALLSRGRLLAYEPLEALKSRLTNLTVDVWSAKPISADFLNALSIDVSQASPDGRRCRLTCAKEALPAVAAALQGPGQEADVHWSIRTPTLEDVYFMAGRSVA